MNMTLERIELFYRKNLLKLMFIPLIALVLAFIIIGFKSLRDISSGIDKNLPETKNIASRSFMSSFF